LPTGPVHLPDVIARMLELEQAIPQSDERDEVPVADVIAALCCIEPGDELETTLELQMRRALTLAREHYAPLVGDDEATVTCGIGFLQGVTFARAVADVRDDES
jgi:hypothetical protein